VTRRLAFAARVTLAVVVPLTVAATATEVVRRIREADRARQVRNQAAMTKRIRDLYVDDEPPLTIYETDTGKMKTRRPDGAWDEWVS
jgi:hypothetical protein